MSTHNISFRGEIRKIFTRYPPLSRPTLYGYASFQGADFFDIRTVYDLINFKGVQGYIHRSIPF